MPSDNLRLRKTKELLNTEPDLGAGFSSKSQEPHPAGPVKHGLFKQIVRIVLFLLYFLVTLTAIHITQFLGVPLYFINRDYYYAWMSVTKQQFGLFANTLNQWFAPTKIRISGDRSVRGQLKQTADGRLEVDFPERVVMIANHQIYTDWLYLWWVSYAGRMHGHIYIILKESLKYIPIIGPGMLFYGFIFLARNWAKDKPRFQAGLQKLKSQHGGPMSGHQALDPMWLLIFPEGTNMSNNGRKASAKWAEKTGLQDMQHQLLPRSTGLQFCLQELKGTVDWIYDCTIAYEGIPRGEYGQDVFTLRAYYFEGRAPKSVNMYWRRLAVSSIPIDDPKEFEVWLRERWIEKDRLLEQYMQTGRFPADESHDLQSEKMMQRSPGFIETEVKQQNPFEFLQSFAPVVALALVVNVLYKVWTMFLIKK